MASKKFFVDIDLNNNYLNNTLLGTSDNLTTTEGAFGYEEGVFKYRDSTTTQIISSKAYVDASATTFINGITKVNGTAGFGGILTQNTVIDSGDNTFDIIKNNIRLRLITEEAMVAGVGFDYNAVKDIAVQTDGKLVMIGEFKDYKGITANGIIRMDQFGEIDPVFVSQIGTAFGTGFNTPQSIGIQSTGHLIVGGESQIYNDIVTTRLVRIFGDSAGTSGSAGLGTLDTAFAANLGTGFNNYINKVLVLPDDSIIVGGWFSAFNDDTNKKYLVKLNANGTLDTTFHTNLGTGPNNEVVELFRQADGKILVSGYFSSWNGVSGKNYIYRINADGTTDGTFNPGTGMNNIVNSFAQLSDGSIVGGGYVTNYNGTAVTRLIKINSTGTLDTSFNTNIGTGLTRTSGTAYANWVEVLPDDTMIVVGYFQFFNGNSSNYITKINPNGTLNTTFAVGTGFDFGEEYVACYTPQGRLFVGGYHESYNGTVVNNIIRINPETGAAMIGTTPISDNMFLKGAGLQYEADYSTNYNSRSLVDKGFVDTALASLTASNGLTRSTNTFKLGGTLTESTNVNADTLALNLSAWHKSIQFNGNGDLNGNGNSGFNIGQLNAGVSRVRTLDDGKLIISGGYTSVPYQGAFAQMIHRFHADGAVDTSFNTNAFTLPINGQVRDFAIQSDGKIVIIGDFTTVSGNTSTRIARLNSDGSFDSAFTANIGTGLNNRAITIDIYGLEGGTAGADYDKIVIGGDFTTFNGTASAGIVKLNANGTLDTTFNSNVGLGFRFGGGGNSWVKKIKILPSTRILVGGPYNYYAASPSAGMTMLNSDGTRDFSFTSPLGDGERCYDFDVDEALNKIILLRATSPRVRMVDLTGAGISSFNNNVTSGFNWSIIPGSTQARYVKFQLDGKILVQGQFNQYNGTTISSSSQNMVRLNADATLDPTFLGNQIPATAGYNFSGLNDDLGSGFNLSPDGTKVYVGGGYYSGINAFGVFRMFTETGQVDTGAFYVKNAPMQYDLDFSKRYTDRSLVDKAYVTSAIANAATSGIAVAATSVYASTSGYALSTADTASNGLTKTGNDFKLGGTLTQNVVIGNTTTYGIAIDTDGNIFSADTVLVFSGNLAGDYSSFNTGTDYTVIESYNGNNNANMGTTINGGSSTSQSSANYSAVSEATQLNIASNSQATSRMYVSDFTTSDNTIFIIQSTVGGAQTATITSTYASFAGAQYDIDYSTNFTTRSLVDKGYVDTAGKYSTTITGDNTTTSFAITHSLTSYNVIVQVFENFGNRANVDIGVERPSTSQVNIIFGTAPTNSESYIVLVTKIS